MTKHDNVSQGKIMKATEFVKEFGWELAKEYLAGAAITDNHLIVFTDADDLKRLVESHELVIVWRMPEAWSGDYDGDVNGLEGANMYLEMYGNYELVGEELERFKQAIADVETCQ